MFIQTLTGGFFGYVIGLQHSEASAITLASVTAGINLLLAFDFYRHRYEAFQIYIVLTL